MSTKTFFGHPIGLANLFATEMWERFSYYGMRALLYLYLTAEFLDGGFGMDEQGAKILYGVFTSLVYVTPIFGGMLADKVLGQRKAIFIGAIVMAIGQLSLAYSGFIRESADPSVRILALHFGLAVLIMGNGFFKPNISTMVGNLYDPKDETGRDSGFTIFYMGINLGAFIAPLVTGFLGEKIGFHWGFLAAGLGMLIGTIWFYAQESSIGKIGLPPSAVNTPELYENNKVSKKDWFGIGVWTLGTIVLTAVILTVLNIVETNLLNNSIKILAFAAVIYLAWAVFSNTNGKTEWSRVAVIFMLAVFNIIFWSGFEQAGTTFNQFALANTDRVIFGWEMPASWFQSVNAIMIFIFAPLFTILWSVLSKKSINPRTPFKFAWGLTLLGLGFIIMSFASESAATGVLVSPLWLVGVYLLHTWGELFISPVGLSMITKLSPAKITSLMMGLWMGSIAIGNFLAQAVDGMREDYNIDLPLAQFIAIFAFIGAAIAFLFGPFMNKMMKGIH